jgi:hypothetical protein
VRSAFAFSRDELARRERDPEYLDPRRNPRPSGVDLTFERDQLAQLLESDADAIERLAARFHAGVGALEAARVSVVARYQAVQQGLDDLVLRYNQAADDERPSLLTQLDRLLEQIAERADLLGQVERPLADLAHSLQQLRERAQQKLLGEAQRLSVTARSA